MEQECFLHMEQELGGRDRDWPLTLHVVGLTRIHPFFALQHPSPFVASTKVNNDNEFLSA